MYSKIQGRDKVYKLRQSWLTSFIKRSCFLVDVGNSIKSTYTYVCIYFRYTLLLLLKEVFFAFKVFRGFSLIYYWISRAWHLNLNILDTFIFWVLSFILFDLDDLSLKNVMINYVWPCMRVHVCVYLFDLPRNYT